MNKKIKALMSASLLTTSALGLSAQSYSSLWNAVEESGAKDQPRQVIEDAMKVYTKAADEGNFPQMMKAWIVVSETKCTLDADSFNIETLPEVKCKNPVEQSVHNAIMGSAYLAMCGATTIAYDEDTQQEYRDKSAECFRQALADKDALAAAKATDYLPVVTKGENSRLWGNDMYSVIAMFVTDYSSWDDDSINVILQDAALYYKEHGNLNASTLMQLNLLKRTRFDVTADYYRTAVKQLLDESESLEAGADVAAEYLDVMEENDASEDDRWQFVKRARELYGKSTLKNCFVNAENEMKQASCHLSYSSCRDAGAGNAPDLFIYPDHPFCFTLDYENLTSADVEVREYAGEEKGKLKTSGKLVDKRHFILATDSTCQARRAKGMPYKGSQTDTLTLPAGKYVVVLKSNGRTDVQELNVTSLRIIALEQPHGKRLFIVVDNKTGKPVPGATLRMYDRKNNETKGVCDETGSYVCDDDRIEQVSASISDKDQLEKNYIWVYSSWRQRYRNNLVKFYTDRTIYRPGQTVHVSGMVYAGDGKAWINVVPNTEVAVRLSYANGQEVDRDTLKSNEWGTFDTEFVLPKDRLPGIYSIAISINGSWIADGGITVEEYKRPTFDVTAKAVDEGKELAFGDAVPVRISAKTFAGVPVQGAAVKYTIKSGTGRYRWNADWEQISDGQTTLDSNGEALVTMQTTTDTTKLEPNDVVGYRLTTEVTDIAGETHTAEYSVYLSGLGFSLQLPTLGKIDLSNPKDILTVKAVNPNGKDMKVIGTYKIKRNNSNKGGKSIGGSSTNVKNVDGNDMETVAEGQFETGKPISLADLPMGTYTLEVSAKDSHGHQVAAQRAYDIYDSEEAADPRTRIKAAPTSFDGNFYVCSKPTFSESQPCEVLLAPCDDDVNLYYYIISDSAVFEQKQIQLNKHLYRFDIDYKKEYGETATLVLAFVRNGQTFTKTQPIAYQRPDNRLQLTWKTFRDNLTPGQQEEWILTVKDHDGNSVKAAEMVATMYDASLDQLMPFSWVFNYSNAYYYSPRLRFIGQGNSDNIWLNFPVKNLTWTDHDYDRLRPFQYLGLVSDEISHGHGRMLLNRAPMMMSAKAASLALTEERVGNAVDQSLVGRIAGLDKEKVESAAEAEETSAASEVKSDMSASNRMRSNFNETAFFYPHLTTDTDGDVHIAFTLPESLTTWRLLGMVHTKDIKYGLIDTTCVAKKDFMVQPNMPRFVREGDKVSIVSRVINQGTADLKAQVLFRLLDAESGKVVHKGTKTLQIAAGQTEPVAFDYAVTDQYPLLVCEITAEAGNCSDGERNYLPVLTAKQYVTETAPFYISGSESKTVDLSTLFNGNSPSATQRCMTLEYTANPAWTAIEALQGIRVPDNSSAISYAASLYANTTASRLAQSIPGFKDALESQRNAATASANDKSGTSADANSVSAINSELADNERMKDIVLRESPWLRDALIESDQRAALIDLFDENLMSQRTKTAKDKLTDLQKSDGSWSWFDGMPGNFYVTLAVCENLALLGSDDSEVQAMLERGMQYLDQEMYRQYNDPKRNNDYLSNSDMRYLFISSLQPDRHVGKNIRKMREEWLGQVEKSVRELTIYGKANCACFLRTFGHEKAADEFLQSVMEYTVTKPGMGRYYATDAAYYSWCDYRIPTQLAAMRAVRQSSMTDKNTILADMQVWLLRQKQTQMWDSPMNTISAVSFLLEDSSNLADASVPQFRIDGKNISVPIDTTKFLAQQLGYVHTEIDGKTAAKGVKELKVVPANYKGSQNASQANSQETLRNSRISWGAVSVRFLENMDQLKTQSSGELKIARRLLVGGKTFDPQTSTLKVGDRVTMRLTVTADRDMDFVQVHLLSPACFEPASQSSGYCWMNGRGGYVVRHDASTDLFFDTFSKGTVTLDIDYYVTRTGEYLTGAATVQCAYAPEFSGHTGSISVKVSE